MPESDYQVRDNEDERKRLAFLYRNPMSEEEAREWTATFEWNDAIYYGVKAAEEFSKHTDSDYS